MNGVESLQDWLVGSLAPDRRVVVKRLSANDTGATGAHQVGLYIPNRLAFLIAPELDSSRPNPDRNIRFELVSHSQRSEVRLVYYNSRRAGTGTRNECRLTRFGGSSSAMQDPDQTGAILVVAFDHAGNSATAWIARSLEEEDVIEAQFGPIEPGSLTYLGTDEQGRIRLLDLEPAPARCDPTLATMPAAWQTTFPTPADLVAEAVRLIPLRGPDVDSVLVARYDCAYAMFRLVEEVHWGPRIANGFQSVAEFLGVAQQVLQRRKARAGRNLELHLATIFTETNVQFTAQVETEPGIRPDFVFPSIGRYIAAATGDRDLDILASKSTLRDRWPAVAREGEKVPVKHLFTMDDGVSYQQFVGITAAGIRLVVPEVRLKHYPATVRSKLWTLGEFVRHRLRTQSS